MAEVFRPPPREANILADHHSLMLAEAKTTESLLSAIDVIKKSPEMRAYYPPPPKDLAANKHAEFIPVSAHRESVALVSYPRSGNTLLRGLLERVTGIYTGSDSRPMRYLAEDLRDRGLRGESVVSKRVWVVKTHYPEREGWKYFTMNRVVLLVRNPFNCIDSYFNMTLTGMHDRSIEESEYSRFAPQWQEVVEREAVIWRDFHKYWLEVSTVPILVVRFEDLQADQAGCLTKIVEFLCEDKPPPSFSPSSSSSSSTSASSSSSSPSSSASPSSTQQLSLELLKQRVVSLAAAQPLYRPRAGHLKAHLQHFTPEQYQYVLDTTAPLLHSFGYAKDFGLEQQHHSEITEMNRNVRGSFMGSAQNILRKERVEEWKYELREIVQVQPLRAPAAKASAPSSLTSPTPTTSATPPTPLIEPPVAVHTPPADCSDVMEHSSSSSANTATTLLMRKKQKRSKKRHK